MVVEKKAKGSNWIRYPSSLSSQRWRRELKRESPTWRVRSQD